MSDLILAGGTVVTADGSFRADVAVAGETIAAVGLDLPRDGAEVVDVSGALVMPGFIDGHTHMDMPFGGGRHELGRGRPWWRDLGSCWPAARW